jgi:hypothetical protein
MHQWLDIDALPAIFVEVAGDRVPEWVIRTDINVEARSDTQKRTRQNQILLTL